jgi:hypothetical protein
MSSADFVPEPTTSVINRFRGHSPNCCVAFAMSDVWDAVRKNVPLSEDRMGGVADGFTRVRQRCPRTVP